MTIFKRFKLSTKKGILFLCILVLLSVFLTISPVWSSNSPDLERIIIGPTDVINDDVYLAGDTVIIDGIVKGDAVLAGRKITVNGTVEGDLIAVGQAIVLNGTVSDDVRMAGQVLMLGNKARVADDVIAAGFSLENQAGSTIGGKLNVFAGQALLAGTVKQDVVGELVSLELSGSVGQNMRVTAIGDQDLDKIPFLPKPLVAIPEIPRGLTLTDSARIAGQLTYKSLIPAQISQQAKVVGAVNREELPEKTAAHAWGNVATHTNPGVIFLNQLQRLLGLILVGWLLMRFLPGWTQSLATTVQAKPLPSLGWGIVSFVGVGLTAIAIAFTTCILIVLFAFTIPSLILPVMGLGMLANFTLFVSFLIFASYVPQIIISFLSGKWLLQKMRPNESSGRFVTLIVGLVAFVLLTAIPGLGALLSLIIVFLGLGSLWLWGRGKIEHVPEDRQLITA